MTGSDAMTAPGAGYPANEKAALEAMAAAEQDLRAAHTWALTHITLDCAGNVAPQAITDCWRDYALIIKRAGRRWEVARQGVIEALNNEGGA